MVFTFSFKIKHNNLSNHVIMFEWFDATGEEPTKRYDTGLIETWTPAPDT